MGKKAGESFAVTDCNNCYPTSVKKGDEENEPCSNGHAPNTSPSSNSPRKGSRICGPEEFVPPEGGWGWVVCVTSLWVNGWVMGTVSSFGILYDFILKQHPDDLDASFKTSLIGAILLGVMLFMCSVSGILCDVIGLRQTAFMGGVLCVVGFASSAYVMQLAHLCVTYGVILGSGFGLLYSPLVAISGHYFSRRLGLVNGIVTFGPSAFTVALSFALPLVLKDFGLRDTLLGFAGMGVTISIATLAWKPLVKRGNSQGKGFGDQGHASERRCGQCVRYVVSKVYDQVLWHNKPFIVWCGAVAVGRFGYMEANFHLVNHVSSLLPDHNAHILVTIMAATAGLSKLVFGLVSDCLRNYRIFLQQGALLAHGAILMLLPLCGEYRGFLAMAVSLGLSDAMIMVLYGPNVVDLVGAERASQAFGFMSLLSIPGFLSAPAITGRLHDELGHYDAGFYFAGALSALAAVIMIFVRNACCHSGNADVTVEAPVKGHKKRATDLSTDPPQHSVARYSQNSQHLASTLPAGAENDFQINAEHDSYDSIQSTKL